MNKFKLFYDVVKTMRDKEVISGTLKVNGKKDAQKIFGLENDFEKNLVNGRTKVKLVTEMDCAGKKVKHESSTEFEMQDCDGHHHCFMKHMHKHHNHGAKCGMKGKLSKLLFVLDILKSVKVEEKDDQSVALTLNLKELPEEIYAAVHEKMNNENAGTCKGYHLLKELHRAENVNCEINLMISKNREIEKITAAAFGECKDESCGFRKMNIDAELSFRW